MCVLCIAKRQAKAKRAFDVIWTDLMGLTRPYHLGINWREIAVRADDGTPLKAATMRMIRDEFTEFAWEQRTGANEMIVIGKLPNSGKPRYIPWLRIMKEMGVDEPNEFGEKQWRLLEKDFQENVEAGNLVIKVKRSAAVIPQMEANLERQYLSEIYKAFDTHAKKTHELASFEFLASMVFIGLGADSDFDEVKENVRTVTRKHADTFSIAGGPNPKIRLLLTKAGKKTGVIPFPPNTRKKKEKSFSAKE